MTMLFILNIAMVSLPSEFANNFWYPIDIAGVVVCFIILALTHAVYHKDWKKIDKKDQIKMQIKGCLLFIIFVIFAMWVVIMIITSCNANVSDGLILVMRGLNWVALSMTSYLFISSLTCFIIKKINV